MKPHRAVNTLTLLFVHFIVCPFHTHIWYLRVIIYKCCWKRHESQIIQAKRTLKTWWALTLRATLFSVLLPSWVESPRTHECVNCEWGFDRNAVENGLTPNPNHQPTRTQHRSPNGIWVHAGLWLAPLATLCQVLLPSWVESFRKHGYVNAVENGLNNHNNAIKTLFYALSFCSILCHTHTNWYYIYNISINIVWYRVCICPMHYLCIVCVSSCHTVFATID